MFWIFNLICIMEYMKHFLIMKLSRCYICSAIIIYCRSYYTVIRTMLIIIVGIIVREAIICLALCVTIKEREKKEAADSDRIMTQKIHQVDDEFKI